MKFFGAICFVILCYAIGGADAEEQLHLNFDLQEDELTSALNLGEIDYDQYLQYLHLLNNGITEDNHYLLNELYLLFPQLTIQLKEKTNRIQIDTGKKKNLLSKQMYSAYLGDDSYRYQSSWSYKSKQVEGRLTLRQEFSGSERIVARSIKFNKLSDNLNEIILGNFNTTFGLGLTIGYPGKKIDYPKKLNTNSFMFPDNGEYNGFKTKWKIALLNVESLHSLVKDSTIQVENHAFKIQKKGKRIDRELIFSHIKIKNRFTDKSYYDTKLSIFQKYDNGKWEFAHESAGDYSENSVSYANILEGKYKNQKINFYCTSWIYESKYFGMISDSKASLISEKITLDKIEYDFSSRRINQSGLYLKNIITLSEKTKIKLSTLYGYKNKDTTDVQSYAEMHYTWHPKLILLFDFGYRDKKRKENSLPWHQKKCKTRLGFNLRDEKVYWKNRLSYTTETDLINYLGYFTEIRWNNTENSYMRVWLNIGKFNWVKRQNDYLYIFFQSKLLLGGSTNLSIKFSHLYNRTTKDREKNQVTLEVSNRI